MEFVPGMYFHNHAEAHAWLGFDEGGEVISQMDYAYPDQFGEWVQWRDDCDRLEAAGIEVDLELSTCETARMNTKEKV